MMGGCEGGWLEEDGFEFEEETEEELDRWRAICAVRWAKSRGEAREAVGEVLESNGGGGVGGVIRVQVDALRGGLVGAARAKE